MKSKLIPRLLLLLFAALPISLLGQSDTFTDTRDGRVYKCVTIGNQVWMAENLCYTESLTFAKTERAWAKLTVESKAYCYYRNRSSWGYGCLYTWAAANVACPEGWHLPSGSDWNELEEYLITNGYNWNGSDIDNRVGKAMASCEGWEKHFIEGSVGNDPSTNNSSGFNALPGGGRLDDYGWFKGVTRVGGWWTSMESGSDKAYYRNLSYKEDFLIRNDWNRSLGYSVRCIKN